MTVLITTSGIGSRLGEISKYTNKCLVRVDDKPSISHIIELYPQDTKFIITLGHFGSHVKQFINLVYPHKDISFVEIDKYQGEGSSLGYSISKCKDLINGPFIFHASDTIVKNICFPKSNFIVGSKKDNVSQFRTIKYSTNKIYDKGEIDYDLAYVGICGIKDNAKFFDILDSLLQENYSELSDVDVVNIMMKDAKFEIIEAKEWFDIGNNGELLATRKHFKSSYEVLDKPQESIFFFKDFVVKFFSDAKIAKNRVARAKSIKENIPEILESSDNFYKYKKVESSLLASVVTPNSFLKLLTWSKTNLWEEVEYKDFNLLCFDFYYHKTLERINKYLEEFGDSEVIINEVKIPHILDLIKEVDFGYLSQGIPVKFHGDFILDNILYDGNDFKLLDWRQDFQGSLEAGDIYYDLAKLNHNLTLNHKVMNHNLFDLKYIDDKNIRCDILVPFINQHCKEKYYQWANDNDLDVSKIKLLTSIIWLNMAPLHEYPLNKFLFHFGKYNLFMNLRDKNE